MKRKNPEPCVAIYTLSLSIYVYVYMQCLSELGECKCVLHANVAVTAEVGSTPYTHYHTYHHTLWLMYGTRHHWLLRDTVSNVHTGG